MSGPDNSRSVGVAWAILFCLILIAMYVLAKPAHSQVTQRPSCGATHEIEKTLTAEYGESPAFAAIVNGGGPMLVFTNPETHTFTVVMRKAGGISCLMAAGEDWTAIEQAKKGTDL
jgi:hypothetical protein